MSSASLPVTDIGNGSAENRTVSELILLLRSAFQQTDFQKVERILTTREENMKREIANWRKAYELMEKKHGELALTKLGIEDELNKCKRESDVLREQIARSKEDQIVQRDRERVQCDREKRTEARYAKLLEDFAKAETEIRKLSFKNSDLDSAKNKVERELQHYKNWLEELNLRLQRMEEDVAMMMSGSPTPKKRKDNELGAEHLVSDEMAGPKKTYYGGKSVNDAGVGTGSQNLGLSQVKESAFYEKDHSLAGAGSVSESPKVESNHMQEGGQHPVLMACNNAKPVQNQMVSKRGSSDKVMKTSVPADMRTGCGVVIEINDSDDEMPTTSVRNVVASGVILSDKEIKGKYFGKMGDDNRRNGVENSLQTSSTKRKRGSGTDTRESKNDDDDISLAGLKTKVLQELSTDTNDCSSINFNIESLIPMLQKRKGNNET